MDYNYTNGTDALFTNLSMFSNGTRNNSDSGRSYTISNPHFISSGPVFDDVNCKYLTSVLLPSLVYVSILLLVGIPGNLMVIYVYSCRWSASTSRVFILALGSYDFINCLSSLTTEIVLLSRFLNFDFPIWCKVSRFVTASINSGSTFILVAIATDRFLRICRIHKDPISVELSRSLVIISVFFAAMTSWPTLLLYGTYTVIIPLKPPIYLKGKTCLITDSMVDTKYPLEFVIFLFSSHFMVYLVLIVLYSFVGRAICHQQTYRKSLRPTSKAKNVPKTEVDNKTEGSQTSTEEDPRRTPMRPRTASSNRFSFVFWKNLSLKSKTATVKKKSTGSDKKLMKELKQSLKTRSSSDSKVPKSRRNIHAGKTTLMLFLVTLLFNLSFLPYLIIVILRYTDPYFYTRLTSGGKAVYNVVLRSYFLNSVVNPIVYCFMSKHFRKLSKEALQSLICCARD
ncbi:cholecystokinin receptor type A-like [Ostrea edulis]|uniref:cholecystokinin receptor type A-like n=1 Tax=Ostrea edulis TaxID=37623 RepID=UPI0024AF875D|nr:cholecystokinin receptor type A-like [Ostrea edulis]XP_055998091.1 cholecystokinin receptor type A-like [Ostrea edulis]